MQNLADARRRIGDYLVRAVTTKPDLWETTQFGLSLIPEDFRPTLMLRTRRLIERRSVTDDHVFGPWADLMALSDEDFSAQATVKTKEWQTSGKRGGSNEWNSLVVAWLGTAALTNKAAVARAYGDLLDGIYEKSKQPVAGSTTAFRTTRKRDGGDLREVDAVPNSLNAEQRELLGLVNSPESPIWFPRRDTPEHMSRAAKDRYGALESNLDPRNRRAHERDGDDADDDAEGSQH